MGSACGLSALGCYGTLGRCPVVEERIEAFQAMRDEYLKELSEQEEQQEQDAAEESEDVAVPEVNEEPTEDTESKVGDSDLKTKGSGEW